MRATGRYSPYPRRGSLVPVAVSANTGTRQRDPTCWLINTEADGHGGWQLPLSGPELLAWASQRWEVEVLHKELKSGFGLGETQAWHPVSAATTPRWVAWTVGCLVLTGYPGLGLEHGTAGQSPWAVVAAPTVDGAGRGAGGPA